MREVFKSVNIQMKCLSHIRCDTNCSDGSHSTAASTATLECKFECNSQSITYKPTRNTNASAARESRNGTNGSHSDHSSQCYSSTSATFRESTQKI